MPAMQGRTCAIFDGVASRSWRENAMPMRALLHYALEIPDLRVGEKFYRNFGLADKAARDEAVHLFCFSHPDVKELLCGHGVLAHAALAAERATPSSPAWDRRCCPLAQGRSVVYDWHSRDRRHARV
jgi:hypothetical protein